MNESIFDCTLEIASWLTNRGKRWARMNDYEKAVKDYTRSIDEFPDCQYPYLHRGDAYAKLGRYQEAIDDYTRAIVIEESFDDALLHRADVHETVGNYRDALWDYKTLLRFYPSYTYVHYRSGSLYHKMGLLKEAIADYSRVLEIEELGVPELIGDAVADVELLKVICDDVFGIESTSNLKIGQKTT